MKTENLLWMLLVWLTYAYGCTSKNISTSKAVGWQQFSMGADVSFLNEIEDYGGVYKIENKPKDPFEILSSFGCNTIRVRLWNNPVWFKNLTGNKIYSNLLDVEKTIRRAKAQGMAVNLDFHYSDNWADPQKQEIPAAWKNANFQQLQDSLYQFTYQVLQYLQARNLTPEMVQIGNENNFGMLWPHGQVVNNDYANFCKLLQVGIRAVRDFSKTSAIKPQIILHEAQLQTALPWFEAVVETQGVTDFDIIGLSHYSKWSTVNNFDSITAIIRSLKTKYNKRVIIVETAYPWTTAYADTYSNFIGPEAAVGGFQISKQGQLDYMIALTKSVLAGGGSGVQYWEPTWITSQLPDQWGTGSSYENCTLFDFDGNALPGLNYMKFNY